MCFKHVEENGTPFVHIIDLWEVRKDKLYEEPCSTHNDICRAPAGALQISLSKLMVGVEKTNLHATKETYSSNNH